MLVSFGSVMLTFMSKDRKYNVHMGVSREIVLKRKNCELHVFLIFRCLNLRSTMFFPVNLPYTCSFEMDFCDMYQRDDDQFEWVRNSGGTGTSNTGPSSASDGNWYIYTEMSSPRATDDAAVSVFVPSSCCLLSPFSVALLSSFL